MGFRAVGRIKGFNTLGGCWNLRGCSIWFSLMDFKMVTTVAHGNGLLHIFLCSIALLLLSGSSFLHTHPFFFTRCVSKAQTRALPFLLQHLLLGSDTGIHSVSQEAPSSGQSYL